MLIKYLISIALIGCLSACSGGSSTKNDRDIVMTEPDENEAHCPHGTEECTAEVYALAFATDNGSDVKECDVLGQMLYNGTCTPYSEVYEVENGMIDEDAHLITGTDFPIKMTFDALAAQHVTANGNGWRHELKVKPSGDYRVGMTEIYELFKAKITIQLDDGAKTIVAQHHAADTATITKLYISDLDEGGFKNAPDGTESDSVAMNGIFDVYIRLANPDGDGETKHLLTTITSGESFYFEEENDHGVITVKINGLAIDSITVADSSESYFKFGNYHQAQYPENIGGFEIGDKLASGDKHGDWAAFYADYFTTSKITFTEMSYIRTVD
ncbi:MAG: polysaccharide lyase family 7 protein [Colwellia sp.]